MGVHPLLQNVGVPAVLAATATSGSASTVTPACGESAVAPATTTRSSTNVRPTIMAIPTDTFFAFIDLLHKKIANGNSCTIRYQCSPSRERLPDIQPTVSQQSNCLF
jgi:hypothetical protein